MVATPPISWPVVSPNAGRSCTLFKAPADTPVQTSGPHMASTVVTTSAIAG